MVKSKSLIIGSIGLDDVTTPFGSVKNVIGGSTIFASLASALFTKTSAMGVIGSDFPKEKLEVFESKGIDISAISVSKKPTMRWKAHYDIDINVAHTDYFEANALDDLSSTVPSTHKKIQNVLIGAFNPNQQISILNSFTKKPKLVVSDTIEHSIRNNKMAVLEMVKRADISLMNAGEARLLFDTNNLGLAAYKILQLNSEFAIIKKGEHGAIMFSAKKYFSSPGYPLEVVKDPTGCGDSFAGALVGYLASTEDFSEKNMRRAIVTASAVASFNAESFSFEKLASITKKDVNNRVKEFKEFVKF